jgi:serine-type D-Ala-D-Ala carboxypeptidase (penicillin-binding protein 5/6)
VNRAIHRVLLSVVLGVTLALTRADAANYRIPPEASIISLEAGSGLVLFEHNADEVRPPASMLKLMMMLMVLEGIDEGHWTLDTEITASRLAQSMGGTQIYLAAGETFPLGVLMQAVAVASANDAAMAVAEGLWGSKEGYLAAMNARARELGMANTEFNSVHGLPPSRGQEPDRTTARDMAQLARACVGDPRILAWSSMKRFEFKSSRTPFLSTNRLLQFMENCDGLKTGYIRAAGFCVAATAYEDDKRVVVVVMGHPESMPRFHLARQLLIDGLAAIEMRTVAEAGASAQLTVDVKQGTAETINLALKDTLRIPTTAEYWPQVEVVYDYPKRLTAPIQAGLSVGEAIVRVGDMELARTEIFVPESVDEATWTWRLRRGLDRWVNTDSN